MVWNCISFPYEIVAKLEAKPTSQKWEYRSMPVIVPSLVLIQSNQIIFNRGDAIENATFFCYHLQLMKYFLC